MKKIIPVIVGPTASGKSAFAIEIAKKINADTWIEQNNTVRLS